MVVQDKWIKNVPQNRRPKYQSTSYFPIAVSPSVEFVLDSLTYQAKPGDLFITTFPKR